MHIPPSMLHGQICPVTAVVAAVGVITISMAASRAKDKPKASVFGSVAALLFAAQMLNFPILQRTSGHLLGGVLVSAILGIPFGVLAMSLVLTLQALLFSDGGLSTLGANIFNMAILGAGLGGFLRFSLIKFAKNNFQKNLLTGFAAWISVMLAAFACGVELVIGGAGNILTMMKAMLSIHAMIGLGEGVITVAVLHALSKVYIKESRSSASWKLLGGALSLTLFNPFVCQWPDGLEWVAQKFDLLYQMAPTFVAPLADYSFPMITDLFWTTVLSGVLGALIVFIAGIMLIKGLSRANIR